MTLEYIGVLTDTYMFNEDALDDFAFDHDTGEPVSLDEAKNTIKGYLVESKQLALTFIAKVEEMEGDVQKMSFAQFKEKWNK